MKDLGEGGYINLKIFNKFKLKCMYSAGK